MFTIKTATGIEFDSDYAVITPQRDTAFVRVIGKDRKAVDEMFNKGAGLPLQNYPELYTLAGVIEEGTGIKLILKP